MTENIESATKHLIEIAKHLGKIEYRLESPLFHLSLASKRNLLNEQKIWVRKLYDANLDIILIAEQLEQPKPRANRRRSS